MSEQTKGIKYHRSTGIHKGSFGKLKLYKGQIDFRNSEAFKDNAITSEYGKEAPFEFFAETFADIIIQELFLFVRICSQKEQIPHVSENDRFERSYYV